MATKLLFFSAKVSKYFFSMIKLTLVEIPSFFLNLKPSQVNYFRGSFCNY